MGATVRRTLRIRGRVQGVFYRQSAADEARRLSLRGFVRNLPDGDVEAIVEGTPEALDEFVRWCHQGPPAARVTDVQVVEGAATGEFPSFEVRR